MPSPGALILVVDDSTIVRHVVRTALEAGGHEVIEAGDGEDALATLDTCRPDVILLDVEMPRLDGLGTLDRLRERPEMVGVPVILLTGHRGETEIVEGLQRGAHDYLTKPFQAAELVARVGAAVRMARVHERLERRNRELDHFATKAAHDLKSPLTVIKGNADILQMGWDKLDPTVRNNQLAALGRATLRAAGMVDDLLTLARLDETEPLAPSKTEVRPLVEEAVATGLDPRENISVEGDFGAVVMPAADLSAVLRNLVENARHYGRSVDGVLRLTIRGSVSIDVQRLEVCDEGEGIPEDQQERIFDPFYAPVGSATVNPASTGVGLSIVRRATERWGGAVTVSSGPLGGSTFTVKVPLASP